MPAANNIPTDALVKVLTALVKHAPFETAGQAGRALMGCGLVCKAWHEAASQDAVWRALFLRCSPALVRARGILPEPVLARDQSVPEGEGDYFEEPPSSMIARSRYFADSIVSPFRKPDAPRANYRHGSLYRVARHRCNARNRKTECISRQSVLQRDAGRGIQPRRRRQRLRGSHRAPPRGRVEARAPALDLAPKIRLTT